MSSPPAATRSHPARSEQRGQSPPSRDRQLLNASRRRDKPQLSCNLCRRRKLRCDRKQPCSTCSSRDLACTYPSDGGTRRAAGKLGMHERILQLDRLVKSIASGNGDLKQVVNAPANANTATSPAEVAHSEARGEITAGSGLERNDGDSPELQYVGESHWATILNSIADLKEHFDTEEQSIVSTTPEVVQIDVSGQESGDGMVMSDQHSLLLYGGCPLISHAELVSALPPRSTVDRHVSRYFRDQDLVSASLHAPTFLKEYEVFWENPSSMPSIWVGLLFGIIGLATMSSGGADSRQELGDDQKKQQKELVDIYREKVVQSLIMGEYTRAGPYALETLMHYTYIELLNSTDADKDIWFLLALEVNLAIRMGFHREPSQPQRISPLRREMRRRLWAIILQADILISSQMGMPRMVSDWQCDTAEPANLNDADLDVSSSVMPPARPEAEMTTTLSLIARCRALKALGAVADLTAKITPPTHAEVMAVDKVVCDTANSIPPPYQMKPLSASIMDTPQVIMSRLFICHLLYKAQMILHRRFALSDTVSSPGDKTSSLEYSYRVCIEAALGMLNIQHILDEETCAGGRLQTMRWRITSVINHQFLTATMILCLLLHRGRTLDQGQKMIAALRTTQAIWIRSSQKSREAQKGVEAIRFVLAQADGAETATAVSEQTSARAEQEDATKTMEVDQNVLPTGLDYFGSDQFGMNGIFSDFGYSDSLSLNFGIGDTEQNGMVPDEWATMDSQIMRW